MNLTNGFELMCFAKEHGYILPAFNTTNMEMTYAIVKGLKDANLPGYIQISSNNLRLSTPAIIAEITRDAIKETKTPIGLHLDHGKTFEDVKACVDAGFTSIMVDLSHLPYEENITQTRGVTEFCHSFGLPVEAELGAIKGKEDDIAVGEGSKTDPDMVSDFIERTQCDMLAVSVGNVHGLCLEPHIDLPLLKCISELTTVPLVLHGGSGIPIDVILEARKYNLIKINYGSELRRAFIKTFGEAYEKDHTVYDVMSLCIMSISNVAGKAQELVTAINRR